MLIRKSWLNMETDVVPQTAEITDVLVIGVASRSGDGVLSDAK